MDKKKIFIVNLSKGRMGETNASLLGSMLVVKIYLAAMSRADEPAARMARLPRFYFYVDEFQSMMNEAFADILSESRKYKLALTLANQYIEQMEEEVRDAVFGNVGTLIVFRVGPFDAEVLETVFDPTFTPEDLVGLGIGQIYLTLMIDGVGSKPFSAETIPPIDPPPVSYRDDCIRTSRALYGRARAEIEAQVNQKQLDFQQPPKEKKDRGKSTFGSRPRNLDPTPHAHDASNGLASSPHGNGAARPVSSGQETMRTHDTQQRNALRAAIVQARPSVSEVAAHTGPIRSPADILRERRVAKQNSTFREMKPAFAQASVGTQNPQPQSRSEPRASFPRDNGVHDARPVDTGEISPETLRDVLRGEDDET